ncbi:hypothetical protein MIN45_P1883 [Methylomarinovum tepidoasis]|uniref:Uncharacterized protein n=1 Tax=Methylomarinovum tepidoasis TaxID=2840183 RepID=A0AAU9C0B6_9GAMM|nr:hypothetical protein [Methylomarinovum sp. IN45]BCX89510.1 hypothetical protein MIN45_P1883 [Methylomarinovum sp. IN45]
MEFAHLRLLAGFPDRESAASFCGVTVRTVRNWEKRGAPPYIVKLFQQAQGDLSWAHPSWQGFRLWREHLFTDGNYPLTAGQLRAYPYLLQVADLRKSGSNPGREWFHRSR